MDLLGNLALGFEVALTPQNLLFCFIGALVGTLIGVLPGLGPLATLAMLLPVTFYLPPIAALIMLAGIYYGAQYGGSTTAILVNLPGKSSSVVTCLDGYQMARKGRAGAALAIAAVGSLFAGTVATFIIAVASPALGAIALQFLAAGIFLADGAGPRRLDRAGARLDAEGAAMAVLGLVIGLIGTDVNSGFQRFTFGIPELSDGIGFVPVAMGLFGITEILINLEKKSERHVGAVIGSLMPTRAEIRAGDRRRCCAARRSARCSACCRAAARCCRRSRPMRSRRRSPRTRRASARARSKAWRRRKRPTTPARRPRSFRC